MEKSTLIFHYHMFLTLKEQCVMIAEEHVSIVIIPK